MFLERPGSLGVFVVAVAALGAFAPASAQTCRTGNCELNGTPAACMNRAAPRTPTVLMGGGGLVFTPANPKIEPGDCIVWEAASATHSSSGIGCTDGLSCSSPPSGSCQWDTDNVASLSTPTSTCFYDPASFPATSADNYYCRIHASPAAGTMRGTLQVTTPIKLSVDKDLGTNSVKLTWSGGGVTGDFSYKVERQSGGDPTFPPGASTMTTDPDGDVFGTTFTDAGDLADPTTRYYLVRNRQTNQ